jgi:hypothetical protein
LVKIKNGWFTVCCLYNNDLELLNIFSTNKFAMLYAVKKGKAVPLQAWGGLEGSRKLRFPDFVTTAQDGGKVVSLTHRPHLPPGNTPILISVRG